MMILADRYHIIKPLSSGGFGQTFLATDQHLPGNPTCIVKKFQPRSQDPTTLAIAKRLFDHEAEILYKLGNHDQIPRLFAHFEQDNQFYLVQEYIEGYTLEQELNRGQKFDDIYVIQFLENILPVLAFIHGNKVIHRDLKPSNLIRRKSDQKIVLIDFGAVKEVNYCSTTNNSETNRTIAIGSPGYMPSEQLSGIPQFSSDIYALGMICLQVLTRLSPQELAKNSLGEYSCYTYEKSISINPNLAKIIDKMVCYDYRQRYQNATEVLAALDQIKKQNFPIVSHDTPTIPTAPPPVAKTLKNIPTTQLSPPDLRNRQILLNKVKNYWLKGVLESSLHGKILLELGVEERFDVLERPWGLVWEYHEQLGQSLSSQIKIIDKFDEIGIGRTLLILGEPGSGKTTSLLQLTRDLIQCAETDLSLPLPIVFNLSSWQQKQSIFTWLVNELQSKYQVSPDISKAWLVNQQLLLLLDGLDEVARERRQDCVEALNTFHQQYGQTEIVVCSRIQDYQAIQKKLHFQAALYIQPLTKSQIQEYLTNAGSELAALQMAIENDITLQELAQSPLILSIMTIAYQGMSKLDLSNLTSELRRQHLFNTYIEKMFKRRLLEIPYPRQQFKIWLSWLAKKMVQESQTVFLVERIQPNWLETKQQKWLYSLAVGILGGLIIGIISGIDLQLLFNRKLGVIACLFFGLAGGVISGVIFRLIIIEIEPVSILKWSWQKAKNNLGSGIRIGLTVGLLFGLSSAVINSMFFDLTDSIRAGLIYGLTGLGTGIIFVLLQGLTGGVIATSTKVNQGIWQSLQNAALFLIIGVLTMGIVATSVGLPFIFGGLIGLLFGFFSPAGLACLQHFTLRLILYLSGYMPWNYARFLDYAHQLIFLQKVGGGYIFIHRLLLEHFANLSNF